MIPFFLAHYAPIVDRIFIHDDGSTDRSRVLLEAHPKVTFEEIEIPSTNDKRHSGELVSYYDQIWKRSRGIADWVIICNIDELFYHPKPRDYLENCAAEGITVIPSEGWDMLRWRFPLPGTDLASEVRRGVRKQRMDKLFAFSPDAILETRFQPGRHRALPRGRIEYPPRVDVRLLHYRYLGFGTSLSRFLQKKRRSPLNYRQPVVGEGLNFFANAWLAREVHQ
jgi:Glycosyl transferase family 2